MNEPTNTTPVDVLLMTTEQPPFRWLPEPSRDGGDDLPACRFTVISDVDVGMTALGTGRYAAVLLDATDRADTLAGDVARLVSLSPQTPVLVLGSSEDGRRQPQLAAEAGAQDWLAKDHVTAVTLVRAILFATQRARSAGERLVRLRDQLAAILGHDLRNPLSSIAMSAGLLLKNGNLNERQVKTVSRIASSSERMNSLIRDLLDFMRSQLGGATGIDLAAISLRDTCRQVIDEVNQAHRDHAVVFAGDELVWGEWDGERVARMIGNLVTNALHDSAPEDAVQVSVREQGAAAIVEVNRKGELIPAAALARFFVDLLVPRPEQSNTRPASVTIRYYIAQQVALAHGGKIEVRSNEGEGTTFTVTLPRKPVSGEA